MEDSSADASRLSEKTMKQCTVCCTLLGLESNSFGAYTTHRSIDAGGSEVQVPLNPMQAVDVRDAIAKEVYARLFQWLVSEINISTEAVKLKTNDKIRKISLLDIFGFECFQVNRFEQLCINYANEKLQQKFTRDVFHTVQEEYISEGIKWESIPYVDNELVIELLEGKGGIIACLNEECILPRGQDSSFLSKLRTSSSGHPNFAIDLRKRDEFTVAHYAAKVSYKYVFFLRILHIIMCC